MNWHHAFHERVEELGRKIEGIRAQVSQFHPPLEAKAIRELAEIDARHADLHHTVQNMRSREQGPRQEVVDALEADFRGLMQSINRWIARQDANASQLRDQSGDPFAEPPDPSSTDTPRTEST